MFFHSKKSDLSLPLLAALCVCAAFNNVFNFQQHQFVYPQRRFSSICHCLLSLRQHTRCSELPHPCCVFTSVIRVHASVVFTSSRCYVIYIHTHTQREAAQVMTGGKHSSQTTSGVFLPLSLQSLFLPEDIPC